MPNRRFAKKLLKVSSIILGILIVLLVGFHFWFKAHARHLIEDLVEVKSHGKLKLKMDKFSFNWFSKKMEFTNAVFYSTDSNEANTSYRFQVNKIKLEVQAILPILLRKSFIIDTMVLLDPDIQVTRLRPAEKKQTKDVSIPEEMGKVYNSIQDALKVLRVSRFLIENGKFTLINKIQPDQRPISIGNLHFQIDNLQVDTTIQGSREKIFFSDNVVLRSHDQDIIFPDERHRLSFSQFRINLQQKLVEFDSCTIAATRKDSSSASFTIFLDVLKLIDIDFDTLYKHEVIKADSVYCVNPTFKLDVELGLKKGAGKPPPKLENIIKQLTGDLQLDNVVVSNADINIKTIRDGVPSSFTFNHNNFEMQGLSIDQEAAKPIKVKSFVMAIRNYENFLKDSSYSVHFDSVLFRDDRISLSNFIFQKLDNGRIINTFNIPQFYLGGLSWDDLVFERRLKAQQATMFNPYISYTVSDKLRKKKGRQNIFESLSAVNDFMDLEYLDIMDGTIDLKVNKQVRIQLEKATLAIQSHDLLASTKLAGIKNSLTRLNFEKGIIHAGNLTLNVKDIRYQGESGKFGAGSIVVKDAKDELAISIQGVAVEKMLVDELTGNIFSEDITWEKGDIRISGGKKGGDLSSLLELKRIRGNQTHFTGNFGNTVVEADLDHISFDRLDKKPGEKLQLSGLSMDGRKFEVKNNTTLFSSAGFAITDQSPSQFNDVHWESHSAKMDGKVSLPSVQLVPHMQPLLDGKIQLDAVQVSKPVIDLKVSGATDKKTLLPPISITDLTILQPRIQFSQLSDSGWMHLSWKGNQTNDYLQLESLQLNDKPFSSASAKKLKFLLTALTYSTPGGQTIDADKGSLGAEIRDIRFEQENNQAWTWNAMVTTLQARDFSLDSLGKDHGRLLIREAELSGLAINSASVTNLKKLSAANAAFGLRKFNGEYKDDLREFSWYNAGLNRSKKEFSLDSVSYRPRLDRDSFMARQSFQTDYLELKTGAVRMSELNLDAFIRDKTLEAGKLEIDNAYLSDYRDNTLPFKSGAIKPLPVKLLKNIPIPLSFGEVLINNSRVDYTQVSEKTREAALIPVTRLNLRILGVKNYDLLVTDSLDIVATAYLLDTTWVRVHVRESFLDTLHGFHLAAQFRPVSLDVFNPVLAPMANVKFRSGFLDTVYLVATGDEYLATGIMQMRYHDLKIRAFKEGHENEEKSGKGLLNFIANTFVIKDNNTSRPGTIFYLREKDRSAINYLVRLAMTGFASSVGVKKSNKQAKKFNRDIKMRPLPPVGFQ